MEEGQKEKMEGSGTLSLDLTLSSDGVKHLNGGLSYPAPENTVSIPYAAEPIPKSDPTFALAPFPPSRHMSLTATESLAFSPPQHHSPATGLSLPQGVRCAVVRRMRPS
jgi:hypothetical protein